MTGALHIADTRSAGLSWRAPIRLFSAQACALSANRMLLITVPWLVLTDTGSAALTALVALCQT